MATDSTMRYVAMAIDAPLQIWSEQVIAPLLNRG